MGLCAGKNRRRFPGAAVWLASSADFAGSRLDAGRAAASKKFQAAGGEEHHAQKQPAVAPAMDVGLPVSARPVADGQINQTQVEFCRTEDQVEIAERVEVAEVSAICR